MSSLKDLHTRIGGVLHPPVEKSASDAGQIEIKRLIGLKSSRPGDACFFFSKEYIEDLGQAQPSALVTSKPFLEGLKQARHPILKNWVIEVEDPYLALGQATELFAHEYFENGIHPSAVVHSTAKIGKGVKIGPHSTIGERAVIGDHTVISSNVVIGDGAIIGTQCTIFPTVVIYPKVRIGNETRIHSNTTIGADGFGYAPILKNGVPVGHQKIHHLGSVTIGNRVEIGANSSIDRGTLDDTLIEDDVKIDNNVQIGHNCHMKRGSIICGSAGMAGSSTLGEFSVVGGLTGVSNKVVIGNYAKVAAMSIVMKDMKDHEVCAGVPQRSHRDFLKVNAWLNKQALKGSKEKS